MRRNSRLHSLVLVLGLATALLSWGCSDRIPVELLDSVVMLDGFDADGNDQGKGSGVVWYHDARFTYVLTARHTQFSTVMRTHPFVPLPFPQEISLVSYVVVDATRHQALCIWSDAGLDAAVIRIDRINRPAVKAVTSEPAFDEPAVCVGRLLNIPDYPLAHRGRFMGWDKATGKHVYAVSAQRGASGGGIFVRRWGRWRLAAITTAIAIQPDGVFIHHATWGAPILKILDLLAGDEEQRDPLPVDLLRAL